ncbi:armadillo-type protein [Kickxella alabastrina]|uniref:armadillo-type protein n=1 Tax=Kickxella alabastrina TaxID=61397 RepID=UPI0022208E0B|nr:armadillo-type protein [Kickxella alabastrina]KAI7823655.1 armadillo-type protein [Kickxella alabastrina]
MARSVAVCRTHVPDSGLLRPLVRLLRDACADVQEAAAAALVNLLTDFSPLRADALKLGLLPELVRLLDAPAPPVRRNALWAVRNLLVGIDDETRREVVAQVGAARLLALAAADTSGADAALREHAVGALRNVAADSAWGVDAIFAAAGDRLPALLAALASERGDRHVRVHALYLANNVAVRSAARCAVLAAHAPLVRAVAAAVEAPDAEVAVAALWCVSSIASHRGGDGADGSGGRAVHVHVPVLRAHGVAEALDRLLADKAQPLDVRDRVKSCMDYFS